MVYDHQPDICKPLFCGSRVSGCTCLSLDAAPYTYIYIFANSMHRAFWCCVCLSTDPMRSTQFYCADTSPLVLICSDIYVKEIVMFVKPYCLSKWEYIFRGIKQKYWNCKLLTHVSSTSFGGRSPSQEGLMDGSTLLASLGMYDLIFSSRWLSRNDSSLCVIFCFVLFSGHTTQHVGL